METRFPVVFIVGATASGKTALAIRLAKQFDGEIICADSRTIYKGMDIGTAKPTAEEQSSVPHWGLDLVEPGERYTAADFKDYAEQKIDEIRARNHIPFIVGGTGLYINGVLYDYAFSNEYDENLRLQLEKMSIEKLKKYCLKNNIYLPENEKNKRYLIRSIERKTKSRSVNNVLRHDAVVVGIATQDIELLKSRIEQRAEQLFENGVVEEAKKLGKKYGWNSEAMTGNIYPIVHKFVQNEVTLEQAKKLFVIADWQLAKRQRTWFKRDQNIRWGHSEELYEYIAGVLSEHKS